MNVRPGKVATVTAGYAPDGRVVAGRSGGGRCADDHVVEQLGVKPSDVQFTEAVRPRFVQAEAQGKPHPDVEIKICPRCQGKYSRDQFPDNVKHERGGPWDEGSQS